MQELLDDLAATGDVDGARLQRDRMLRHAIERILTQVVELAVSVNSHVAATQLGEAPRDYRSSFTLAETAGSALRDYGAYVDSVAVWIDSRSG